MDVSVVINHVIIIMMMMMIMIMIMIMMMIMIMIMTMTMTMIVIVTVTVTTTVTVTVTMIWKAMPSQLFVPTQVRSYYMLARTIFATDLLGKSQKIL